jgi:hypothetical protein
LFHKVHKKSDFWNYESVGDPISELPGQKSPKFMYTKKYFLRAKPDLQLLGSKN